MTYRRHLDIIDAWFASGVQAGNGAVLCRRECSACCLGPFDISPADAELVRNAVQQLDTDTRTSVERRAVNQLASYRELLPHWQAPWNIDELNDAVFDELTEHFAGAPCPALDARGSCLIYDNRPATCRMTGLPMKTPEGDQIENVCPILSTSEAFASLDAREFDLMKFEDAADAHDIRATRRGHVRTTVAGAIDPAAGRSEGISPA